MKKGTIGKYYKNKVLIGYFCIIGMFLIYARKIAKGFAVLILQKLYLNDNTFC